MINEALYNKTVNILFDAYFNDTLQHSNSCACAIGNLVAANNNLKFCRLESIPFLTWQGNLEPKWFKSLYRLDYSLEGLYQMESTGYERTEVYEIERAFEGADQGNSDEDWMFNGLVKVLDVLKEIHQVDDNAEVLTRFSNHYKTLSNATH